MCWTSCKDAQRAFGGAGSCTPCIGDCEGRAVCAVGAVCDTLCAISAEVCARCAALHARGRGERTICAGDAGGHTL